MGDEVVVRVLGPLAVSADGGLPVGLGPVQRRLLALLAVRAGSVVTVDRIEEVVGFASPAAVRTAVSRLRRVAGGVVTSVAPGYVLDVGCVDARRFEQLLADAADRDPMGRVEALDEALRLWRGSAFVEFAHEEWAQGEAVRLDELRSVADEDRIEALLRVGRTADAVSAAQRLIASEPLRERVRGLHIAALAAQGRAPEALRVYHQFRSFLADETGLEPSAELIDLERQILAGGHPAVPRHGPAWVASVQSAAIHAAESTARPTGTITFLFTDIEGSTRSWESDAAGMRVQLADHDAVLSAAVERHGGWLFKHTGDGVCAAFSSPVEAVAAAVEAQRALSVSVRMGIVTGEAQLRGDDYFGPTLNCAARVMAAGHGGQILVAGSTAGLVEGTDLVDLGGHRLRDLSSPVRLFQVRADGIRERFPPLRTSDGARGNLPVAPTTFIGREGALSDVLELMSDHRLVTLTGVGGSGKTRLALAVGALLAGGNEVCFCDLTAISASSSVARTVARAVGVPVRPRSGTDGSDELVRQMESGQLVLVLDNCEHLLDACATLVGRLVTECPGVEVLATSREPLGVPSEHVYPVPPLATPSDDWDTGAAAVTLFAQRAVEVRPGFSLVDENRAAVLQICRRLDGLPLALELAAARMSHLSAPELLMRLDRRFELLRNRQSGRPERHRTLAATIDWSYDLLSDAARRLLRRLAVFAGRFGLEAVEAVCAAGVPLDAVDVLGDLVDKSLVVAQHEGSVTTYRLLETVRLYAADHLAGSDDEEPARRAHGRWFLSRLESIPWDQRLFSAQCAERLEDDYEDLRRAVEWAASTRSDALVARFVASMAGMIAIRGHFDDFDRWLPIAHEYESGHPPEERIATALSYFVYISRWDGDIEGLKDRRERLADLIENFPPGDMITAAGFATLASLSSRDVGERWAMELYADLALSHVPPDAENMRTMALCQKARALLFRGEHEEAISLLEAAVHGDEDPGWMFSARADLALACHIAGQHEQALAIAESRLGLGPPLIFRLDAIFASLAAAALGDLARGRAHLRFAIDTLPTTYRPPLLINDLRLATGALAVLEGRDSAAAHFFAGLSAASVSTNALAVLLEHYQSRLHPPNRPNEWPQAPKATKQTPDWWPEILAELANN